MLVIFIIFAFSSSLRAEKLKVYVTHQWLAVLANFIGSTEVEIIPLKIWNADGVLINSEKGRFIKELNQDSKIMAFDNDDLKTLGLESRNYKSLRLLYSKKIPVEINKIIDPSVMPFIAQRVLTILSEWTPNNYPVYQRRLAEFQARLSSTMLAGQVMKNSIICDMSIYSGVLMQAAGCKIIKPSSEDFTRWQNGNYANLREYAEKLNSQGIIILMDLWTPKLIKKYLSGRKNVFIWESPEPNQDYPSFLHEQYISLWQKIILKRTQMQAK